MEVIQNQLLHKSTVGGSLQLKEEVFSLRMRRRCFLYLSRSSASHDRLESPTLCVPYHVLNGRLGFSFMAYHIHFYGISHILKHLHLYSLLLFCTWTVLLVLWSLLFIRGVRKTQSIVILYFVIMYRFSKTLDRFLINSVHAKIRGRQWFTLC